MQRTDIRLALPAKGRMAEGAEALLSACGMDIYKPNPRQYQATIPTMPNLTVLFQRPADIVVGVQEGTLDFGITGLDMVLEKGEDLNDLLILHDQLGFGRCRLALAVPESWDSVQTMVDLQREQATRAAKNNQLRIATKFPNLTRKFLVKHGLNDVTLIDAAGTLEIAPEIGYADMIADLVSSGLTLRDNRLRPLDDGTILSSESIFVANKRALRERPLALEIARQMLEYIEAYFRGRDQSLILANMRADSPEQLAQKMQAETELGGLQGPTISPVYNGDATDSHWFSVTLVAQKSALNETIRQLRSIGGSGVVVTPVTYIFEEEPVRYQELLAVLKEN